MWSVWCTPSAFDISSCTKNRERMWLYFTCSVVTIRTQSGWLPADCWIFCTGGWLSVDTTAQFCKPGALELKCEIRRRLQRAQRNRASVLSRGDGSSQNVLHRNALLFDGYCMSAFFIAVYLIGVVESGQTRMRQYSAPATEDCGKRTGRFCMA